MSNILTVDFEDWNEIGYRRATGEVPPLSRALERQMAVLLEILQRHQARATFFVLGLTAEKFPELVRAIARAGHEIASHGHAHRLVHQQTPQQFREDTQRSRQLLEDLCGTRVRGYRAAEFSIRSASLWALDVLAELGFEYDSSIFPVRHRRYGIADFFPLPARYTLAKGGSIVEIPLAASSFLGAKFPAAGGGYFRLLPAAAIRGVVAGLNRKRQPAVTYFHPYEFDSERLRIFATARPRKLAPRLRAARFGLHQNLRRHTMPAKLETLLRNFRFVSCDDFLQEAELGERRNLLSTAG